MLRQKAWYYFFLTALSEALEQVMACQCPDGAILGVLQGKCCSPLCVSKHSLVRMTNVCMVEDRAAPPSRYAHKRGCGAWQKGSHLLFFVSQISSVRL